MTYKELINEINNRKELNTYQIIIYGKMSFSYELDKDLPVLKYLINDTVELIKIWVGESDKRAKI